MYTKNFYGGNGIVGAQVPLGAGIAFAHKYKGDGGVNFSLYGDGAANQGQVSEAFNLAKLWSLPIVFICENNQYAMGTPQDRHAASSDFYKRGDYIPGLQIDGMDVLAVREATRFALEYCQENGPLVYEISTYRYHGHSMSDPGTSYRSRDEVQEVRQSRDPITGFRDRIVGAGLVDLVEVKKIEQQVRKEVDIDIKKAKEDRQIGEEELFYDMYQNNLQGKIRGITPWDYHEHKNTQVNRRRKPCRGRKCRGKGKKRCPGVEDIKEKIGAEMEDDLCILNQLGWIDSEGEAVEEVMTADLMTLPTDVSAKLSEDKIGSCADKMVSKMSKKHRRCAKMYSADDVAQLSELGLKVASYKCFQKQFAKSCQAFVKEEIFDFYKAQIMQETTTTLA